jgi:hypothetical protein
MPGGWKFYILTLYHIFATIWHEMTGKRYAENREFFYCFGHQNVIGTGLHVILTTASSDES